MFKKGTRYHLYPVNDGGYVIEKEDDVGNEVFDAIAKTPEEIAEYFSPTQAKDSVNTNAAHVINNAIQKRDDFEKFRDGIMEIGFLIVSNRQIEAIRIIRDRYKVGLADAKFFIDEFRNQMRKFNND